MKGSRSAICMCSLVVLVLGCVLAPSASAQSQWTCTKGWPIGKDWEDADCRNFVSPNGGVYGHQAVAERTGINWSNIIGALSILFKLKGALSGVTVELQATGLAGTGETENRSEGATTWYEGTGVETFKGVTVTAPAGKGCKVKGGEITTSTLSETSKGLTNQVKFGPASGETFAKVTIEGCSIAALNNTFPVNGSVIGSVQGSVISFTHTATTEQNTLKFGGNKVGIEGQKTKKGPNGNALAVT